VISADGIIKGVSPSTKWRHRPGAALGRPAGPLKYIEKGRSPIPGADSIRKGLMACIGGLLLVCCSCWYITRPPASIRPGLLLNMLILMGIMAYFKATLSMPASPASSSRSAWRDANVLVLNASRGTQPGQVAQVGHRRWFQKAFWTIFDSNLTTVISAVFLFQFGTGP